MKKCGIMSQRRKNARQPRQKIDILDIGFSASNYRKMMQKSLFKGKTFCFTSILIAKRHLFGSAKNYFFKIKSSG